MIIQQFIEDGQVRVDFRLSSTVWADTIHLVGDFNQWSTRATPMRFGEYCWEASLTLAPGGTYYYAYLIDGASWCSEHLLPLRTIGGTLQPITFIPIEILHARLKSERHRLRVG